MTINFRSEAEELRDELVAWRRDFHMHPELAFEEVRTAGIVADALDEMGLEVQRGVGKTGVVAILEGGREGKTVLWRADMDALPIDEANDVPYASTVAGKMHACGHDAHTAIGLGVARVLTAHRESLAGRIKFVFQPAEEVVGGARAMIADGVLENPRPDVSLGLHLWNSMPVGCIGVTDGAIMAGSSTFDIHIHGRGGHAASPHQGVDPVVTAAQIILALNTIVSRNVNPLESAVVSVTRMRAANAYNIIPDNVHLAGTFRAFSTEIRDMVAQRIHEIASSLSEAMNCMAEVQIKHGTIPTVNDPAIAEQVRSRLRQLLPDANLISDERTTGSEDVSYFMDDIPGTYVMLGSNNEARGLNYGHHHPRFDFDEDVLPLGVAVGSSTIFDLLSEG
jgi:amidohydrolase